MADLDISGDFRAVGLQQIRKTGFSVFRWGVLLQKRMASVVFLVFIVTERLNDSGYLSQRRPAISIRIAAVAGCRRLHLQNLNSLIGTIRQNRQVVNLLQLSPLIGPGAGSA